MSTQIHPTALVDPTAALGLNVTLGPWTMVGPRVVVGDRSVLAPRAILEQNVHIGQDCVIGVGSVIGGDPQDLKFQGEETWVEIGSSTTIREYSTINRGTAASGTTIVGTGCLIMSYVHLAHDCQVGNGVIIANATQCAGHVTIHDKATISGLCALHQFVTIGQLAFLGGCTRVNQDVPPFVRAVGSPMEMYGINSLGIQRAGIAKEVLVALKTAYRTCFNAGLPLTQAIERARQPIPRPPEVEQFLGFLENAGRGIPA